MLVPDRIDNLASLGTLSSSIMATYSYPNSAHNPQPGVAMLDRGQHSIPVSTTLKSTVEYDNYSSNIPKPLSTNTSSLQVKNESCSNSQAIPESSQSPLYSSPVQNGPSVDILVSNVVCKYRVRCHLNLRKIAMFGANTEYDIRHGRVLMRLRKPSCFANIWSSGKISIFGAKSEHLCLVGARRIARILQKMEFPIRMCCFEIVNVLASCHLPFGIRLPNFSQHNKGKHMTYEPELHPAANYSIKDIRCNIKIYDSGALTCTGRNTGVLEQGIQQIYPLLEQFQKPKVYKNTAIKTKREVNPIFLETEEAIYDTESTGQKNNKKRQNKSQRKTKKRRVITHSQSSDDEPNDKTLKYDDTLSQNGGGVQNNYQQQRNINGDYIINSQIAQQHFTAATALQPQDHLSYMPPTPTDANSL